MRSTESNSYAGHCHGGAGAAILYLCPQPGGDLDVPITGRLVATAPGRIPGTQFRSEARVAAAAVGHAFDLALLPGVAYQVAFLPDDPVGGADPLPPFYFALQADESGRRDVVLPALSEYLRVAGIVLAGFLKILLPLVIVVPGLILFAAHPEAMLLPWKEIRPQADTGYVSMLQTLIPVGLRGLFLAALFGAIQSALNAVINSTATVFTIDIYKRLLRPDAPERHYVRVGVIASAVVTVLGIVLAPGISRMGHGLFVYIHTLFAFFAPPFASVFLLGILFRRINTPGATVTVFAGFAFALLVKLYVQYVPGHPLWIEPFAMQAFVVWLFCTITCVVVSLLTPPPPPEKITDKLTFNWRTLNITQQLGGRWYRNVVFWWLLFVVLVLGILFLLSGLFV